MSGQTFNTRNTMTGRLARLTEDQISTNPEYLQIVPDDAKPYEPGMFKPGKVGEFDNPEPPTDAEIEAQANLDAILETSAPNSKVAREARAAAEQAEADAKAAQEQAEAAAKDAGVPAATEQGEK
jgi:hypothetical protein